MKGHLIQATQQRDERVILISAPDKKGLFIISHRCYMSLG